MPRLLLPAMLLAALATTSCGLVYKPTIQQGNVLDQEDVENLEPGMTRDQVLALLGPPSVTSLFEQERWDYLSTTQRDGGEIERRAMTLWFDNGVLARTEGTFFTEEDEEETASEQLDDVEYETVVDEEDREQPATPPPPPPTGGAGNDPIPDNNPIP